MVVSTAYPRGTSEVMAGADTLCSESRIVVLRALPVLTICCVRCPLVGFDLELPVTDHEWRTAALLIDEAELAGHSLACLHPGASRQERRCVAAGAVRRGRRPPVRPTALCW